MGRIIDWSRIALRTMSELVSLSLEKERLLRDLRQARLAFDAECRARRADEKMHQLTVDQLEKAAAGAHRAQATRVDVLRDDLERERTENVRTREQLNAALLKVTGLEADVAQLRHDLDRSAAELVREQERATSQRGDQWFLAKDQPGLPGGEVKPFGWVDLSPSQAAPETVPEQHVAYEPIDVRCGFCGATSGLPCTDFVMGEPSTVAHFHVTRVRTAETRNAQR